MKDLFDLVDVIGSTVYNLVYCILWIILLFPVILLRQGQCLCINGQLARSCIEEDICMMIVHVFWHLGVSMYIWFLLM